MSGEKMTLKGKELLQYFADAIGANAVIPSPDTGRPYIKVGTRGDASLYLSTSIEPICHHPPVAEGEEQKHVQVWGVVVRFMQVGGPPDSFAPFLSVRASGEKAGTTVYRLSRFNFALGGNGNNPGNLWTAQGVTGALLAWLTEATVKLDTNLVNEGVLTTVLELPLEAFKPEEGGMFTGVPEAMHEPDEKPEPKKAGPKKPPKNDPPTYLN